MDMTASQRETSSMTKITQRGWIVLGIIAIIIIIWALAVTTPPECRVSVSEMSDFCKKLIYS